MEVRYQLKNLSNNQRGSLFSLLSCLFQSPLSHSKHTHTHTQSLCWEHLFQVLKNHWYFNYYPFLPVRSLSKTLHPVSFCLEHHVAMVTPVCRNWKGERFVQKKSICRRCLWDTGRCRTRGRPFFATRGSSQEVLGFTPFLIEQCDTRG